MFGATFPPFAFLLAQMQQVTARVLNSSMASRTQRGKAANQNVIVGNLGAVYTGTQSANAVNT